MNERGFSANNSAEREKEREREAMNNVYVCNVMKEEVVETLFIVKRLIITPLHIKCLFENVNTCFVTI